MGCDIHMYIEYKCGNGLPWQADEHHTLEWDDRCRDNRAEDEWCDYCKENHAHKCENGWANFRQVNATGRDYYLFGELANVRGTSEREALGLPSDISPELAQAAENYGADGHSHSYISLEDFKCIVEKCGYYKELTPTQKTCADAFYNWQDPKYKRWDKPGGLDAPQDYVAVVNYCERLKQEKSIDKQILGADTDTEVQVRLVFWFDN